MRMGMVPAIRRKANVSELDFSKAARTPANKVPWYYFLFLA
jgi:hypothetical protein